MSETAGRLRSIAKIAIVDVAAPLIAYSLLRSAGMSTVTALVLSGVFPALGVAVDAVRHRRLEIVGALVLAGIIAGTVLGLVSHSTRLVLILVAWTIAYGRYREKRGRREMAAAEGPETGGADPRSRDGA